MSNNHLTKKIKLLGETPILYDLYYYWLLELFNLKKNTRQKIIWMGCFIQWLGFFAILEYNADILGDRNIVNNRWQLLSTSLLRKSLKKKKKKKPFEW